jgi:hypothetical protein
MPTDPKWRSVAKKSGQRIGDVIAIFNFLMVNASANANERGRTHNLFADDIAAALDMENSDVDAVFDAMIGKIWDESGFLLGWEKRQPKREDSSSDRAKKWRDERKRTQANANERPDTDTDTDNTLSKDKGENADSDKIFWQNAKSYLGGKNPGSLIGKWCRDYDKADVAKAIGAAQVERAVDPIPYIERVLRGKVNGRGDTFAENMPC